LLERAPFKWWHDHRWGAKALLEGKVADAIVYAEASKDLNAPMGAIASFGESALLDAGQVDEAYANYAMAAAHGGINLAVLGSVRKKYPGVPADIILRDLATNQPDQQGKWFAAAKDAGQYGLAIEFARRSPADPRTLARAARDFAERQPEFAPDAAMEALKGMRWARLRHYTFSPHFSLAELGFPVRSRHCSAKNPIIQPHPRH
jgi:hypothetical protein